MLIAADPHGNRILATRETPDGSYHCPECEAPAILKKRGRKITAHFAHAAGTSCQAAGETWRHLLSKQVLAEEFTRLGYHAQVEVSHRSVGRRIDVVASRVDSKGFTRRVAVEVQDSAIQVDTAKARVTLDRKLGYDATVWLFTSHRAAALMAVESEVEVRVPNEMLWANRRYGQGVQVIDPQERTVWRLDLTSVHRDGESYSWYEDGELTGVDYPGYTPRTLRTVHRRKAGFRLVAGPGRFGDRWAVAFAPDRAAG